MIKRIAAYKGRWIPVVVLENSVKLQRAGYSQYSASVIGDELAGGQGDTIEEAVDDCSRSS